MEMPPNFKCGNFVCCMFSVHGFIARPLILIRVTENLESFHVTGVHQDLSGESRFHMDLIPDNHIDGCCIDKLIQLFTEYWYVITDLWPLLP